jgi:hypothetical protein
MVKSINKEERRKCSARIGNFKGETRRRASYGGGGGSGAATYRKA